MIKKFWPQYVGVPAQLSHPKQQLVGSWVRWLGGHEASGQRSCKNLACAGVKPIG